MAKNVLINGVTYNSVPYVNIPLAEGSGNAKFVDTDIGGADAAAASDIRSGKKAFVGGNEVTGTVPVKVASDVSVDGKTVSVPAGIYDSAVEKSVSDGVVTPSASVSGGVIGDTASDYAVTVTPSASVTPGYISSDATGTAITKYVQVEDKNVTPSLSVQEVLATAGKLIKKVIVAAVNLTATATEADVMSGKTFYANSLTVKTGTATVPLVGYDSTTHVLTIS